MNNERVAQGCLLGIDIGGTFTDVVLAPAGRPLALGKYLTTPEDPTTGVLRGVSDLLDRCGVDATQVTRVAHATTLATNVILERRGVPVAFVTTRGFRDIIALGRGARVEGDRFNLHFEADVPPVDASHCFEVTERVAADGSVLTPLDEEDVARVIEEIRSRHVEAVAVSLMHSYANADHEQRVAALMASALHGVTVVASSEVWPELREYERATTTLMSAYVGPVMKRYLTDLEGRLAQLGVAAPVHVMGSNGGAMSVAFASQRAVHTIESGPAAGVVSARTIGAAIGHHDVISFDMGGTTAKAGVVRDGQPDIVHEFFVGGAGSFGGRREGTGVPIKIPAIDLAEIGSGGGSIAWVDDGGALRVGPHSAGSSPGPACYGGGGQLPTVTDADLILGYINPAFFAGGTVPLYPEASEAAIRTHVAEPLGVGVVEAAQAIHEITNAAMSSAVHVVTVQRGIDPRRFAMVALGGAGPMHAARIAERFDIDLVVIPVGTGVGSAVGLLASDVTAERAQTLIMGEQTIDLERAEELFGALEEACIADLAVDPGATTTSRSVDMRYLGQAHEINVPAPATAVDALWVKELVDRFHLRYSEAYGKTLSGSTEFVSFRVTVVQPVDTLGLSGRELAEGGSALSTTRSVYFAESDGFRPTPVLSRDGLAPEWSTHGPAVIEERASTIVVPPSWDVRVDEHGNLLLTRQPK